MTTWGCCQVDKYYRRGRQLRRVATSGRKERVQRFSDVPKTRLPCKRVPAPPPPRCLTRLAQLRVVCAALRCVGRDLAACRRSWGGRRRRVDRSMNDRNASPGGRRPPAAAAAASALCTEWETGCMRLLATSYSWRPGLAQYTYILCLLWHNIDTDAQNRRHSPRPFQSIQSIGCNGTRWI